jgi:DnaJ-class molecular chaperone with C-terminal Zn finger domain
MICERCHGTGYLPDAHPPQPCEACGGVGVSYCCSGETAINDPLPLVPPLEIEPGLVN